MRFSSFLVLTILVHSMFVYNGVTSCGAPNSIGRKNFLASRADPMAKSACHVLTLGTIFLPFNISSTVLVLASCVVNDYF